MFDTYEKCNRFNRRDRIAAFLSAFLLMFTLLTLSANATVEGSGKQSWIDIFFRTEYFYGDDYRYCVDVVYSDLILTYQMTSLLINDETGDRTIEEGNWLSERTPLDNVSVTVINHADTPVALESMICDADFDQCGTKVRDVFDTNFLDAVRHDPEGTPIVSSALMRLAVEGEPIYEQYMGKKELNVTVRVHAVSGIATSGREFRSPFPA